MDEIRLTQFPFLNVLIPCLLAVSLAAVTEPVPTCVSPYGVRDDTVCIAADGYPYYHGVQVG